MEQSFIAQPELFAYQIILSTAFAHRYKFRPLFD